MIDPLEYLLSCMQGVNLTLTKVYVFGSYISPHSKPNDIDILVVSESSSDIARIKGVINDVNCPFPFDVIFMSDDEEREFNFILETGAMEINVRIQQGDAPEPPSAAR